MRPIACIMVCMGASACLNAEVAVSLTAVTRPPRVSRPLMLVRMTRVLMQHPTRLLISLSALPTNGLATCDMHKIFETQRLMQDAFICFSGSAVICKGTYVRGTHTSADIPKICIGVMLYPSQSCGAQAQLTHHYVILAAAGSQQQLQ